MTKEQEIRTILSLKGDTYFAEKFGEDIDKMCENIHNDFPIETGCNFMSKENALRKSLENQKAEQEEKLLSFAQDIILSVNTCTSLSVTDVVNQYIGKDEVIKFKHSSGIQLSDNELDYLVSKLK